MRTIHRLILITTVSLFSTIGIAYGESGTSGFLKDGNSTVYLFYPGAIQTGASGINDIGDIVGNYADSSGITHGFLKSGDVYTTIDFPGAISTFAYDINNSGQIVGGYTDPRYSRCPGSAWHNFIKDGDIYNTINYPGSYYTDVAGINNAGQIVGSYKDSPTNLQGMGWHGYMLDGSTFISLIYPGSSNSEASDINNAGKIVGYYWEPNATLTHGFVMDGKTCASFDIPGAAWSVTMPMAINNADQIIAYTPGTTYLKDGNTYSKINLTGQSIFFSPDNYVIYTPSGNACANGINDIGQIVGSTGYTAKYVPEPATMLLLGFGLMGIAGVGRKLKHRVSELS